MAIGVLFASFMRITCNNINYSRNTNQIGNRRLNKTTSHAIKVMSSSFKQLRYSLREKNKTTVLFPKGLSEVSLGINRIHSACVLNTINEDKVI